MSFASEQRRLQFVTERDGEDAALEFAKRVYAQYRSMIVNREGMCSDRNRRREYTESCIVLRAFINGKCR